MHSGCVSVEPVEPGEDPIPLRHALNAGSSGLAEMPMGYPFHARRDHACFQSRSTGRFQPVLHISSDLRGWTERNCGKRAVCYL